MSESKNHHFVSQTHIKNFFNQKDRKIFIYDKVLNNHYFKTTTKSLFSETKLNSRFKDGKIDHNTIEKDLNYHFEKDFAKNTRIIEQFINDRYFTDAVNSALIYFAKYGIIGEIRTPRYKKHLDDCIKEALNPIQSNCTKELSSQIENMFEFEKQVKYSNTFDYSEVADKILSLMGGLIFQILIPETESDYFVIPDFSAGTAREKINKYFNPDVEEIAYIGLPLTSKIYIHFYSEKLFGDNDKPDSKIMLCPSNAVEIFNAANLDYCNSKIACESEEYLKSFITKNITQ